VSPSLFIQLGWAGVLVGAPAFVLAAVVLARRWSRLKRSLRLGFGAGLALCICGFGAAIQATFIEPKTLVVREYDVASPHWRGAPLRIAALGDLHIGSPHVPPERVTEVVARVNALEPDLVVLLGDYIPGHAGWETREAQEVERIEAGIAALTALEGEKIAVIGNHDVWYGRVRVTMLLEAAGFVVLWNQNAHIVRRGGGLVSVVGLEDDWTGAPDFTKALYGAVPNADRIVLSHSPDPYAEIPPGAGVYLAAHTHCGQVSIPFIGRPIVPIQHKRYACGRIDENGKTIIVTGGIGTSGPPVRFLNPPEIAFVTLRSGAPMDAPPPIY